MSDRFSHDTFDDNREYGNREYDIRRRDLPDPRDESFAPLPPWLEEKHLEDGEVVEWVRGPRFNPTWERYVTHWLLFVFAGMIGLFATFFGAAVAGQEGLGVGLAIALVLVIGSIYVLGVFSGFFTRLVVTNQRVAILQGYELVRSWGLDQLPPSMIRYRASTGGERAPSIDLGAVKSMLGGSADGFADSKTIMAFSKSLNNIIKGRDDKTR